MKSVIICAGTYGEVYLSCLQEVGVDIVGFLDDNPKLIGTNVRGVPVLGNIAMLETLQATHGVEAVYCPLGNNKLRVKFLSMAKALGYKTPNFIHHSAVVSNNVSLGEGVYILMGSNIMPYTVLKDYTMISSGVNVVHHSVLEEGVFLSNGCNFGASVVAHKYVYCGMGSTIMTGVHSLGENCMIGAGAVVIKDVEPNAVMAGVPAKLLKYKE